MSIFFSKAPEYLKSYLKLQGVWTAYWKARDRFRATPGVDRRRAPEAAWGEVLALLAAKRGVEPAVIEREFAEYREAHPEYEDGESGGGGERASVEGSAVTGEKPALKKRDRRPINGQWGSGKTLDGLPVYPPPERFTDPSDKKPDPKSDREWVYKHYGMPANQIVPELCPNAAAWQMLLQAREDPRWFMEKIYQAMKPGAAELDEARRRDESLPIREALEEFERYCAKEGAT